MAMSKENRQRRERAFAKRERKSPDVRERVVVQEPLDRKQYNKRQRERARKRTFDPAWRKRKAERDRKKRATKRTAAQYAAFLDLLDREQAELEAEAARTGIDINVLIADRLNNV
jgi:hypothetical protein